MTEEPESVKSMREWAQWQVIKARAGATWEKCEGCKGEFEYPHLCRAHRLCLFCHMLMEYLEKAES